MNRAVVLAHLEIVERYIAKGEQYIGRLQEIIDRLGRDGPETAGSYNLLHTMEATQEIFFSHRHWLLKELKDSKLKHSEWVYPAPAPVN